jgi:hypothetical protein
MAEPESAEPGPECSELEACPMAEPESPMAEPEYLIDAVYCPTAPGPGPLGPYGTAAQAATMWDMPLVGLSLVKGPRAPKPPRRISWEASLALLRTASAGHLALSQGALPLVVPVTCRLDGGRLVLRAAPGLFGASGWEYSAAEDSPRTLRTRPSTRRQAVGYPR